MIVHLFTPQAAIKQGRIDQLYQAYAESHESAPPEISDGFKDLEEFLCNLPNAVFNLCCRLYSAYERKAFVDGVQYGAYLTRSLL